MPFFVIQGTFRLVGSTRKGTATGYEPDGDSMQFKPRNIKLLDRLERLSQPYRPTLIGSVQLRFEGIDALELHYAPSKGGHESHQPRPLADDARSFLTKELDLDPVQYSAGSDGIRVQPPAANDGAPGFILARNLEAKGRPVAFVFAGKAPAADGKEVRLTPALLRRSVNYRLVRNGFAYPLFYDTLFIDLREELAKAAKAARAKPKAGGLWRKDRSQSGLAATKQADLEANGVIFPKLFRRLTDYFADNHRGLSQFLSMPQLKKEQVQDMDPKSPNFTNFTHFDNMLRVSGGKVSLRQQPETLVFVSEK